jgi:hypothetical protein
MATAARAVQIKTSGGQRVPDFVARQASEIGSVAVWLGRRGEIGIMDIKLMLGVLDELLDDITRLRSEIMRLEGPEPDHTWTHGHPGWQTGPQPPKATPLVSPETAK